VAPSDKVRPAICSAPRRGFPLPAPVVLVHRVAEFPFQKDSFIIAESEANVKQANGYLDELAALQKV
jgi:hypothetical protein